MHLKLLEIHLTYHSKNSYNRHEVIMDISNHPTTEKWEDGFKNVLQCYKNEETIVNKKKRQGYWLNLPTLSEINKRWNRRQWKQGFCSLHSMCIALYKAYLWTGSKEGQWVTHQLRKAIHGSCVCFLLVHLTNILALFDLFLKLLVRLNWLTL